MWHLLVPHLQHQAPPQSIKWIIWYYCKAYITNMFNSRYKERRLGICVCWLVWQVSKGAHQTFWWTKTVPWKWDFFPWQERYILFTTKFQVSIAWSRKYHNTLRLPTQILNCFQFLLGLTMVPRENKTNAYSKFGWTKKWVLWYFLLWAIALISIEFCSIAWPVMLRGNVHCKAVVHVRGKSSVKCLVRTLHI